MKPISGRAPTATEIAFAVVWPSALIALLSAIWMFDVILLTTIIWVHDAESEAILSVAAKVSAALGVLPGAAVLLSGAGGSIAARRPPARAKWLRKACWTIRTTTALARAGAITGIALLGLLIAVRPSGVGAIAVFASALLAAPALMITLRLMQRRMDILAARARRHARRLCPDCHYDITGLTRCPECGAAVRRSRV